MQRTDIDDNLAQTGTRRLLRRRWYFLPLSLLVLGIVSVVVIVWINTIREKRREAAALYDTIVEMRIKVTSAHLWLRHTLTGVESVDDEAIINDLHAVIMLADSVLSGGGTEHGYTLKPFTDPELRPVVQDIRSLVIELQKISLQLLQDAGQNTSSPELIRLFDGKYNEFHSKATFLTFSVEEKLKDYTAYADRFYLGALIGWTSVVALSIIGLWNRELRRKDAEEALARANEDLEQRVLDRTAALSDLNRQLQQEISDRRKTEEALRRSQALYRGVVEDQTELICRFLPDGTLTFVNEAYARFFGTMPDEMIGRSFLTFIPAEDRGRIKSHLALIGREVPWASLEHEVVRPGGEIRWMQWMDRAVFDEQGRFIELQSVGRDITDQRQAAEALRKSEAYFRSLIENALDIIAVLSTAPEMIFISASVRRVLGYEPDELAGENPFDLIHAEDRPKAAGAFERIVGTPGLTESTEFRFAHRDGSYRIFEAIGKAIPNDHGELIVIVNARDTTERRLAEQALEESEASYKRLSVQFHTLLDAIPDSITLLGPDLKVLWANRGTAVHLQRDLSELAGHHCYSLWHHLKEACSDCPVTRSFLSGQAESARISGSDGRFWDLRAFPVKDDSGSVANVIGLCNDVTEKLAFEAERMRTAHLASLGELAAGVAHEINNPVNGIINYAQLMFDECDARGGDCQVPLRIMKEGNRIANIVKSLLSFARERKEEKAPVAVSEVLHDALALTDSQFRKDGIDLRLDLPEDLPRLVAQGQQIQQVFLNLLSNARYALNQKYPGSHGDKVLEITGSTATAGERRTVELTFRDHGCGIPAQLLDKIILPFFSTKPKGVGTGLGLSISHGIVSDHGGTLSIESTEGEYTRVTVTLPAES